jgi:hypothetical protein
MTVSEAQENPGAFRQTIGNGGATQPMFEGSTFYRRKIETKGRAQHMSASNTPPLWFRQLRAFSSFKMVKFFLRCCTKHIWSEVHARVILKRMHI